MIAPMCQTRTPTCGPSSRTNRTKSLHISLCAQEAEANQQRKRTRGTRAHSAAQPWTHTTRTSTRTTNTMDTKDCKMHIQETRIDSPSMTKCTQGTMTGRTRTGMLGHIIMISMKWIMPKHMTIDNLTSDRTCFRQAIDTIKTNTLSRQGSLIRKEVVTRIMCGADLSEDPKTSIESQDPATSSTIEAIKNW